MSRDQVDGIIRELAARQHGVVGRRQLVAAGVTVGAIRHRINRNVLRPLHRGVYATGPVAGRLHVETAAVLACGRSAALSHRTAGGLWRLIPSPQREAPVDVTGPRTLRGPAAGVRLHRTASLPDDEVAVHHGVPVTSPARTVLDLAACLGPNALERALARGVRQHVVALEEVDALVRRHPQRGGTRLLRALVADAAGPDLTRSQAEARFLALLRRGGVPRPRSNARVGGLEVDFYWPEHRLAVEVDGFAYHGGRAAFEDDRRRDALLATLGVSTVRFTWRQIVHAPSRVLGRLCLALGARSAAER